MEIAPLDKIELFSGSTETSKSTCLDGIFSGLFKFLESFFGGGNVMTNGTVTDFTAGVKNAIRSPAPAAPSAQAASSSMPGNLVVMAGAGLILTITYKVLTSLKS